MVCTGVSLAAARGKSTPRRGLGVPRKQSKPVPQPDLQRQASSGSFLFPVLLNGNQRDHIPIRSKTRTFYCISDFTLSDSGFRAPSSINRVLTLRRISARSRLSVLLLRRLCSRKPLDSPSISIRPIGGCNRLNNPGWRHPALPGWWNYRRTSTPTLAFRSLPAVFPGPCRDCPRPEVHALQDMGVSTGHREIRASGHAHHRTRGHGQNSILERGPQEVDPAFRYRDPARFKRRSPGA